MKRNGQAIKSTRFRPLKRPCDANSHVSEKGCWASKNIHCARELHSWRLITEQAGRCLSCFLVVLSRERGGQPDGTNRLKPGGHQHGCSRRPRQPLLRSGLLPLMQDPPSLSKRAELHPSSAIPISSTLNTTCSASHSRSQATSQVFRQEGRGRLRTAQSLS